MNDIFKTPKGSVLPLLSLKGKLYLMVAHRLIWFREEKPDWSIETEAVVLQSDHAVIRATIKDEKGRIIATAHKREDTKHFQDAIEKAEAGAIGRALSYCGYGTQFTDLEEGTKNGEMRIVDTPLEKSSTTTSAPQKLTLQELSQVTINFGKKYRGLTFGEVAPQEIASFLSWCEADPERTKSRDAKEFVLYAKEYLGYMEKEDELPF